MKHKSHDVNAEVSLQKRLVTPNLTFYKKRLNPNILSQLQNVETQSHHSFKKIY